MAKKRSGRRLLKNRPSDVAEPLNSAEFVRVMDLLLSLPYGTGPYNVAKAPKLPWLAPLKERSQLSAAVVKQLTSPMVSRADDRWRERLLLIRLRLEHARDGEKNVGARGRLNAQIALVDHMLYRTEKEDDMIWQPFGADHHSTVETELA